VFAPAAGNDGAGDTSRATLAQARPAIVTRL